MNRLQIRLALGAALLGSVGRAHAVDHDNIDAGRPLPFDDAETIAFGERTFEFGAAFSKPNRGKLGAAGDAEWVLGFRKNWQLNLGLDPEFASQNGNRRRFDVGDLSVGVQHNLNRETESSPAFGFRFDASLPTGRGARGVDTRLRAIASRKFGTYGRLHLNADLNLNARAGAGERRTQPSVIVGYSTPLGFPTCFNRTLVSQIGLRAAPDRGQSAILNVGVGVRQQVTPRSVFDVGVQSDLAGGGDHREKLRVVAGYSTAF